MFPPISKHLEVGWKNEAQPSFFNQLRGVWKWEETLFRVFDIASQTIDNSWRNSKQKLLMSLRRHFPVLESDLTVSYIL